MAPKRRNTSKEPTKPQKRTRKTTALRATEEQHGGGGQVLAEQTDALGGGGQASSPEHSTGKGRSDQLALDLEAAILEILDSRAPGKTC